MNYVTGKQAATALKICQQTLRTWEKNGHIDTIRLPSGKRMYNLDKYLKSIGIVEEIVLEEPKMKIAYVRVSTPSQMENLERQKDEIKDLYPTHLIVEDIGSGIDLTKKGIRSIIDWAIQGKVDEVVVLYKDRLARFGYDLIKDLIESYSQGRIIIVHKNENEKPEEELIQDVVQILNVYSAKMNGMRRYKRKKPKVNF